MNIYFCCHFSNHKRAYHNCNRWYFDFFFFLIFSKKINLIFCVNHLHSRQFTWNFKSYFLLKRIRRKIRMSSAKILVGSLRVKSLSCCIYRMCLLGKTLCICYKQPIRSSYAAGQSDQGPHCLTSGSLTLVLLSPDIPCLCKQYRSRSVGFWRSQLIWISTVCH